MSSLHSCPNCGREAKDSMFSNFFDVHTCSECGQKFCNEFGNEDGTECPNCNSTDYLDYDKVYAD